MRFILLVLLFIIAVPLYAQDHAIKQDIIASIDGKYESLAALSDEIWTNAELAFKENKSAKALADFARYHGMEVDEGVAGIPTAFTAKYGEGEPVIGILGEFDALPGLSQKTVPSKEPLQAGAPGHGCGHNVFGVGSLAAAIAIKEQIEAGTLQGTVKFFGTPAEERFFGKLWMIREGVFEDVDVMVDWHPGAETKANVQSSLSLVDFIVEFYGSTSHASSDPWRGRSASDALELYTTGINYYREHVLPTVRMHYQIQSAGEAVNIVPDYAKIWTRIRDTKREGMVKVWKQVERMAEGAAMMANVDYKITLVSGLHEILVNRTGGERLQANLEALGPIEYSEDEQAFARSLQESLGQEPVGIDASLSPLEETLEHPGGGSTDAADVSYVVPTIRLSSSIAPEGTPWHSWAVVAYSGMSIGHKGMVYASKALAMTMVDLFEDAALRVAVTEEFNERKGDYVYEGIIPEGPPPINSPH